MLISTNMAWPDDPYGTGQLWRKEPQLLTAFAVAWARREEDLRPAAYAVVYLRLHRTASIAIDETLKFGFRVVAAQQASDVAQLVSVLDLDVLRARRLAKILVGWRLGENLRAVSRYVSKGDSARGLNAVAQQSEDDARSAQGMAVVLDLSTDLGSTRPEFGEWSKSMLTDGVNLKYEDLTRRVVWAPDQVGADLGISESASCPASSDVTDVVLRRAFVLALRGGIQLERCSWQDGASLDDIVVANSDGCF